MYQLRVFLVSCVAALAACGANRGEQATQDRAGSAAARASPVEDAPTTGSIGPVEYRFAPQRLTRAEIQIEVPPGYKSSAWATKLVPIERARALGEKSCRYGSSSDAQVCSAEMEDGLAMALLDRPIGDYRRAFTEESAQGAKLEPSTRARRQGFKYSVAAGTSAVIYAFYPVGERTLLLARRFSEGGAALDPALGQVLASLRFPVPAD